VPSQQFAHSFLTSKEEARGTTLQLSRGRFFNEVLQQVFTHGLSKLQ
jgi:hypothetical protein